MPDNESITKIVAKLEKLEKQNRQFKLIFILISLLIISFGLVAWQNKPLSQKIVEAERFVVRDDKGIIKGIFGLDEFKIDKESSVSLEMVHKDMRSVILPNAINITRESKGINIHSSLTLNGFTVSKHENDKNTGTYLADGIFELTSKNKGKILINSVERFIYMMDENNKIRCEISLDKGGYPVMALFDAAGIMRAVLGSTAIRHGDGTMKALPESSLMLFDEKGRGIFNAP